MSQGVAGIVFTCLAISIGFGLLSIVRPELSTWPPPRTSPWPRPVLVFVGPLFPIAVFGQLPLGILDWNSFVLDHWARFVAGGALIVWASRTTQSRDREKLQLGQYFRWAAGWTVASVDRSTKANYPTTRASTSRWSA